MAKGNKAPVSERALVQRINRALKEGGEVLRASRGAQALQEFGSHFIVDVDRNTVTAHHVDLEKLGRELSVLKSYERLAAE